MIKVQYLNFAYGAAYPPVFEDFNLELRSGSIVGLLGKNGTGKSTLLYLLAGMLLPQRGTVAVNEHQPAERTPQFLSELFLVPEEFELPEVPLSRFVALYSPYYPNFSCEVLGECLHEFELTPDVHLARLSMGQRKKVFMSFALAAQTRLLLLDEPTNGLDIPSKAQFRSVISRHMNDDRTIVISTHQVRDVEMLIDHVVMLSGTGLLLSESVQRLSERFDFAVRPAGDDVSDALYAEPTLSGTAVMTHGTGLGDTPVSLELLFNALSHNPMLLRPEALV